MNVMALTQESLRHPAKTGPEERLFRSKFLWIAGFCCSLMLGLMSGIGGFILSFTAWFSLPHPTLNTTSTLMLMAAFPLLLLAAHCMDRVDAVNKRIHEDA